MKAKLIIAGFVVIGLVVLLFSGISYASSTMAWDFECAQDRQVDLQIAEVCKFGSPFPTQYEYYYIYSYDDSKPVIGTQQNSEPEYGTGSSSTSVVVYSDGDGDGETGNAQISVENNNNNENNNK
ncbi:MAG: hypothetical protein U9O41_08555 [Candidatus Aerophobetes bacterium]|nr:hypothetical protein [Candidatus Aerophobetes bacterium]